MDFINLFRIGIFIEYLGVVIYKLLSFVYQPFNACKLYIFIYRISICIIIIVAIYYHNYNINYYYYYYYYYLICI